MCLCICLYVCIICLYVPAVVNAPTATAKSVLSRCTAGLHIICRQLVMSQHHHHHHRHRHQRRRGHHFSRPHTHTHTHRWRYTDTHTHYSLPLLQAQPDLVKLLLLPPAPCSFSLSHSLTRYCCLCRTSRDWSPKNKNLPKTNCKNAKIAHKKTHTHTHFNAGALKKSEKIKPKTGQCMYKRGVKEERGQRARNELQSVIQIHGNTHTHTHTHTYMHMQLEKRS